MNILVIGNGFDLAHELPTKYWDFIEFVKVFKALKDSTRDRIESISYFQRLDENIKEYLLSDAVFNFSNHTDILKEFYKLINNNIWIEYFDNEIDFKNKGWIDFEFEISEVIKSLDYLLIVNNKKLKKPGDNEIDDNFKYNVAAKFINKMKNKGITDHNKRFKIGDFYGEVAKEIIDELYEELNNLIRCLEIYLEEFLGKINIEKRLIDILEIEEIDKVISFNYTKTYEKIYDVEKKCMYDYIHGEVNLNRDIIENNMVLGINEYLNTEEKDEKIEFIKFKKYFQRIYKETKCLHRTWLERAKSLQGDAEMTKKSDKLEYINKVYIYGHSLDITDKDILKDLINFIGTQTTIFYYDKYDYAQKIANMVRIVGQEYLNKNCYGLYPKIIFKEIKR
ncbi:bacteriophage abortive infection AbiH family protein [Clostridium sp.]|uniref:bacteriophage abortive infection AbiH family protein n=1 Tax=Clostridium sp. TaxID=1506 RepID=UPI0026104438|nr:bacteriophage abortive infection AbiH family protein [Clostridium sp.]